MKNPHTAISARLIGLVLLAVLTVILGCERMGVPLTASVFGGAGLGPGITATQGIGGIATNGNLVALVTSILGKVLDFITLIALVSVVVAGIYLVASGGDEGQKDKAKKMIFYTCIGIIVILFARLIVVTVNHLFG